MTEPPDPGLVQGIHVQPPIQSRHVDRDRYHPVRVRANLAYIFVGALLVLVAFLGVMAALDRFDQMREFSEIALPALVGLAGTAVGFYFRELTEQRD